MLSDLYHLLIERHDFFFTLFLQHAFLSYTVVFIAAIIGVALGIWIEKRKSVAKIVLSAINFLYTIPSIAMFGFLIPVCGIGTKTAMISLVIYALLPIVLNTYTGLTNVSKEITSAAKAMGATEWQILFRLKLPLALPVIYSAIRNALIMTIAVAGVAAFIGAGGLGVGIFRGITTNNMQLMFLSSLLIAIFAVLSDLLLDAYGKRILFARKTKGKKAGCFILLILLVIVGLYGAKTYRQNTPKDAKVVHLATKPMTEQFILGEMIKKVITDYSDLTVEVTEGVGGGTSNIHVGMVNKSFDLYPEYTGTSWNQVLGEKSIYQDDMFQKLNTEYNKQFGLVYEGMYGFNNTFGIAMRKETADKYHIKTYSDLADHANQLALGAEYDFFERKDGYDALKKKYHMDFGRTVDIEVSLKYKALEQGKIDAIVVFTTDAMLSNKDFVVLKDDQHFFPSYKAGTVVRSEVLKKYPELGDALNQLKDKITDDEMAHMNYEVEVDKKTPKEVAYEFLEEKGIIHE